MASLTWDENGARIQVVIEKKQRNIRWGKVANSVAETAKGHIEVLRISRGTQSPIPKATMNWLTGLDSEYHHKLSKVGLVEPRDDETNLTLASFVDGYINNLKSLKPYTIRNFKNTRNKLVKFFGADKRIRKITEGDAIDFKQKQDNEGYASATTSKAIKHCKQFFNYAVKKCAVNTNPFQNIKTGKETNKKRLEFITREIIDKVIAVATDDEWKAVIALSRYGGLRCPSETLALKWSDVDFAENRINVTSPKTEIHDEGFRVIPLFPELKVYLEALFNQRNVGVDCSVNDFVITRYRDSNSNLRTRMRKNIKRAKITPWERTFHNLRASRIIELSDQFPAHVVKDWCGNSEVIQERHYLKTTQEHYDKALGSTVIETEKVGAGD